MLDVLHVVNLTNSLVSIAMLDDGYAFKDTRFALLRMQVIILLEASSVEEQRQTLKEMIRLLGKGMGSLADVSLKPRKEINLNIVKLNNLYLSVKSDLSVELKKIVPDLTPW